MSLRLIQPGVQSLLVDAGRPRWRSLGVPLGGAADRGALAIGNALVGNPPTALALELTLVGPTLEAIHPAACAIFGAPFHVTINGKPGPDAGTTFMLETGDVLKIGGTLSGARGYLCVADGFDAPEVLGSRSSLEPLAPGATLTCSPSRCEPRGLDFASLPSEPVLHVLDGPQREWFDATFFKREYEVSPASNRMGLRFLGEPLRRTSGELASEAVAPGAVQITNDGLPVVLGVDGQTIGGYPKIAHVIRADLDRLAQLRPGDRVRFVSISEAEAETLVRQRAEAVRAWLARLSAAERTPRLISSGTHRSAR